MKPIQVFSLVLSAAVAAVCAAPAAGGLPRERLLLDLGWRFHLGDDLGDGLGLAKAGTSTGPASVEFGDATWRKIDLPHDWAIELPFDPRADTAHGSRAIGEAYRSNSIAWYRRSFELAKEDEGRRIWLEFDGVYRNCDVFVNGWLVAHHDGGYNSFRCDITNVALCGGRNLVAVHVDATHFEGWFYEGAGIYRHVWLVKTAPVAVAADGVFVYGRFGSAGAGGPAEVVMQTRILNAGTAGADARVSWQVLSLGGSPVAAASAAGRVGPSETLETEGTATVLLPQLWSPETPALYRLVTSVSVAGAEVDRVETPFGLRTVGFDANRGFLLNGQPYPLKGTSNHQDHAGVGSALPDALQDFRIARLKEMGCNAYRTAHHPPTPELLDACDRLGMLVMDENRVLGTDEMRLSYLEEQVRRDRNHAGVAIWSLGNEEFAVQTTQVGQKVAAAMQALVKRLDPTRPVTFNADVDNVYAGVNGAIEVRGWSYRTGPAMDSYHREHPLQPNVGSEQGSTIGTRGIYADDKERGYVSSYDDTAPPWAQTAETWMSFFATRPWLSGGFVWTGFDYRGEPTPYGWPCISSHFGIMDTCGFPKDNYWYYQAWWGGRPVLHLSPHWNWAGREGRDIDVRAMTNCEEVELFLNGRSVGRKAVTPYIQPRWKVPYAPGTLSARGFSGGKLVLEGRVETTGAPAAVRLQPDRNEISANGRDAAVYTVSVVDAQGRVVPDACNRLAFEIEGPGRILGVGNGDPSCHEPDKVFGMPELRRIPVAAWRWKDVSNPYRADLAEAAVTCDDLGWQPADAERASLNTGRQVIYRAHIVVSPANLEAPAIALSFGRIDGGVIVFVNGERVGFLPDNRIPLEYDVKARLHAGDNVVAVTAGNGGTAPAGLSGGAALVLAYDPPTLPWSRSAFNGLAQVIVQSTGVPGTIRLRASADGLAAGEAPVETRPPGR